ncbi:MAG: 5'/3'-nucleotidase SurE [Chloroflexi bacterium HGW-Chloroflexi-10]|nr:MAG: 5'/3'-nucleotidase SurE [Chloroflexi bacterium HGW-Chloroflexi-10]
MRILVSNDDGIFSPGLTALAEVASQFGDVVIFAPDYEQSAVGHAITIQRPLKYHRVKMMKGFEAYRVNGTPADCVAMGLYHLGGADLVLSGINLGSNLGSDVWHSGTVAAAKQGVILGVRAIAFSQVINGEEPNYEKQKPYIKEVIRLLTTGNQPRLVNVNLPKEPIGLRWTHQSVRHYNGKVVEGQDPNGRKHFWFSATPLTNPDENSDRWAIDNDLVSLTPLRLSLTDEDWLNRLNAVQQGSPI